MIYLDLKLFVFNQENSDTEKYFPSVYTQRQIQIIYFQIVKHTKKEVELRTLLQVNISCLRKK